MTASTARGSQGVETGKILVFVNLGYSKLDVGSLTAGVSPSTPDVFPPTNGWSVDQQSGKVNVNFFGSITLATGGYLNLNGNSILNVSKILGMDGKWSLDENGNLAAETVTAKKLCLEEVCIEKAQLKTLLQNAGLLLNTQNTIEVSPPPFSKDGGETSAATATSTGP